MNRKTHLFSLAALLLGCASAQAQEKPAASWNIHDGAGLPDWIKFSIQQRSRYETYDNTFRSKGIGGDQVLAFRTEAFFEAAYRQFRIGAEFIDSRLFLDDSGTPINNTMVNETTLLQAYLAWQSHDVLSSGLDADVKFGRQTLDIGSRRLVARNSFRNTINNFNGVDFNLSSLGQRSDLNRRSGRRVRAQPFTIDFIECRKLAEIG